MEQLRSTLSTFMKFPLAGTRSTPETLFVRSHISFMLPPTKSMGQKKTRPPPESGDGGWESWIVSPRGTKYPTSWTPQPMGVSQKPNLSLCAPFLYRNEHYQFLKCKGPIPLMNLSIHSPELKLTPCHSLPTTKSEKGKST